MNYNLLQSDDKDNFFDNQITSLWNCLSKMTVGSTTINSLNSNLNKDWVIKPWPTQWDAADVPQPNHQYLLYTGFVYITSKYNLR